MTEIVVTGYFAYQGDPPKEVVLGNIASTLELPKSGLTLYYGYQSTLAAMSRVRQAAEAQKMSVCTVSVTLEVPENVYAQRIYLKPRTVETNHAGVKKKVKVPGLDQIQMVFMDRIGKEGVDVLSEQARKILARRDIPYEEGFAYSGRFMTAHPWFLDQLVKSPYLKSAEGIFYWSVEDRKPVQPVQLVTLFSDASVTKVDTRGVRTVIRFPKQILSKSDKGWKDPQVFG